MSRPASGYQLAIVRSILEDIVGVDNVSAAHDVPIDVSIDQYWLTHMWREKGEAIPKPTFLVRPASTEEVSRIMRVCTTYRIPVIPRGGGSGTQGGASTPYGGLVLDTTRMDRIFDIDETSLVLDAQPGINGRVLEDALNERGLMLAHYPSSVDISTLGGYLAARGSGVMSTKYGKAEDLVLSLEVVLPNGEVLDTLATPNFDDRESGAADLCAILVGEGRAAQCQHGPGRRIGRLRHDCEYDLPGLGRHADDGAVVHADGGTPRPPDGEGSLLHRGADPTGTPGRPGGSRGRAALPL